MSKARSNRKGQKSHQLHLFFSRATKAQVPGFIDKAESGKGLNWVLVGVQMRNTVHEEHYRQECDFTWTGKFINITEEPLPPSSRY